MRGEGIQLKSPTIAANIYKISLRPSKDMFDINSKISSPQNQLFHRQVAPIISFGKNAKTVLTMAIMVLTTIKLQFRTFSPFPISCPKSFKWNAKGKMMQIEKHATLPSRVMIRSKEGKRMAMMTNERMIRIRSVNLSIPRVRPDMPFKDDEAASDR